MKPDSVITFTNLVVLVTAAVTILLAVSVCIVCTAAGTCIWRRKCEKHDMNAIIFTVYHVSHVCTITYPSP